MEAHEAFERFEKSHHAAGGDGEGEGGASLAQRGALVVAVIAAFLAVATFLGNESVKEAIQNQTKTAQKESDASQFSSLKANVAFFQLVIQVIGTTSDPRQGRAARAATRELEKQLTPTFTQAEQQATAAVDAANRDTKHRNDQHLFFELAEVALQIGIVLASVSIIARRSWLLLGGVGVAIIGLVVLVVGATVI